MSRDYVVIGGGIYGAYVAWELAKRDEDVLLLEKRQLANEASGGPGKRGVRANGRDPRELPLMQTAYDIWPRLSDEIGESIGYERVGGLELIERSVPELHASSLQSAPAQVWLQRQYEISSKILSREEVIQKEPHVSDAVQGAIYCENDGVVDQTAVTRAVGAAAAREGAEIREGVAVAGLDVNEQQVTAVRTDDGETIEVGDTALLLSNSHAPEFLKRELDISLPVWNFLPQVLLTEPVEEMPISHLIGHSHRLLAMKGLPDDRLMITGGWPAEVTHGGDGVGRPIPEQVEQNFAQAEAVFPDISTLEIDEIATDHLESCTLDSLPIIDQYPAAKNLIVATGWTGHGFAISPAVSELLAQWAAEHQRPSLLRPFSLQRFTGRRQGAPEPTEPTAESSV
ncbi:NAD(P)/FAD-dependent oxidoreductase [Halorarum halobium]|uniref:NAD(P)/FAD-dependent oxidoreductase n=1 Tax=Halorarum halobium TaxID=3075121 RepID=UPI0028AAA9F4|nr:FAD-binding oxidoreductase [Halobaculum sp. XH14]